MTILAHWLHRGSRVPPGLAAARHARVAAEEHLELIRVCAPEVQRLKGVLEKQNVENHFAERLYLSYTSGGSRE